METPVGFRVPDISLLQMCKMKSLFAALIERSNSKSGFEGCWHGVAMMFCRIEISSLGQTVFLTFVCNVGGEMFSSSLLLLTDESVSDFCFVPCQPALSLVFEFDEESNYSPSPSTVDPIVV